jgi:hypothetical protein
MIPFRHYHRESATTFKQEIQRLVPDMIAAAQRVYDAWEGRDDPEVGSGGICDAISREIGEIIVGRIPNADVYEGGHDGDDHAYTIAYKDGVAYAVDIPYGIYERGGGYAWTKVPGVRFAPHHVIIDRVDYLPPDN